MPVNRYIRYGRVLRGLVGPFSASGSGLALDGVGLLPVLPRITDVDLVEETAVVANPSRRPLSLDGYSIFDEGRKHVFAFPQDAVIPPRDCVTIFCSPAKHHPSEDHFPPHAYLWRNRDGSLRRAEILNNEGDSMVLANAQGDVVSAFHRHENGDYAVELPLSREQQERWVHAATNFLALLRIFLLLASGWFVLDDPVRFAMLYASNYAIDFVMREVAGIEELNDIGVKLACTGDRVAVILMLLPLALLYNGNTSAVRLFAGLLLLDVTSSWVQAHQSDIPMVDLTGHKLVTVFDIATEGLMWWLYLAPFGKLPAWASPLPTFAVVFLITCCIAKQFYACLELLRGLFPQHRQTHPALSGLSESGAAATHSSSNGSAAAEDADALDKEHEE